jgi:hypothetical protein
MTIWSSFSCIFCGVVWIVCDISGSGQSNGLIFKVSDIQETDCRRISWSLEKTGILHRNEGDKQNRASEIGLKYRILAHYCCSDSTKISEVRRLLEKTWRGEEQQNARYKVITVASTKLTVL